MNHWLLEGINDANMFVGTRARIAKVLIIHTPGLANGALREEYARLLRKSAQEKT